MVHFTKSIGKLALLFKCAEDLSDKFGYPIEDAVRALRSACRGESDEIGNG